MDRRNPNIAYGKLNHPLMQYFKLFLAIAAVALPGACQRSHPVDAPVASGSPHDSVYASSGDRIIAQTFDTLRHSLLSAAQSGGFPGAIDFCNENARALTDLYADSVQIRRTAVRYRNPENKPDSLERTVLKAWESDITAGRTPSSRLVRQNGVVHYFKPIVMQAMCVNCHGAPGKHVNPATLSVIREKYPQDFAIDFEEGDLRGSWHLIFKRNR